MLRKQLVLHCCLFAQSYSSSKFVLNCILPLSQWGGGILPLSRGGGTYHVQEAGGGAHPLAPTPFLSTNHSPPQARPPPHPPAPHPLPRRGGWCWYPHLPPRLPAPRSNRPRFCRAAETQTNKHSKGGKQRENIIQQVLIIQLLYFQQWIFSNRYFVG